MHRLRRSATLTLLLLLAVTFGPLLCRIGGDQAWLAGRAAAAAEFWRGAPAEPAATFAAHPAATAPIAVADTVKNCSGRHAPSPGEAAPLPAPHRAEPLAPDVTAPGPLAADLPHRFALARPPTGAAPTPDHTALLPVLRI
ncbi:membrane protein [Streptomyces noursei ATCC 11455]|nr:membrane protein [Streptomyces noursei ATCC 11455]